MGVVYRAQSLGRHGPGDVAVKVIDPLYSADPKAIERFEEESSHLAKINHPNVVRWFRTGFDKARKVIFLVMEWVPDGTLTEYLEGRGGQLPPREAAELVSRLAGGVQAAHDKGVLHRDIKPDNVLMSGRTPKIADFGIAHLMPDNDSARALRRRYRTITGVPRGTPGYMPPEQVKGATKLTPAADVYGLGALLYHLLTGMPPFHEQPENAIHQAILTRDPVDPERLARGLPYDLAVVCRKCLRRPAGDRYTTAAELAADLDRFLANRPIRARDYNWLERAARRILDRRITLLSVLAVGLALLAIALPMVVFVGIQKEALIEHAEREQIARYEQRLLRAGALCELDADEAKAELENPDDCPHRLRDDERWRRLWRMSTVPNAWRTSGLWTRKMNPPGSFVIAPVRLAMGLSTCHHGRSSRCPMTGDWRRWSMRWARPEVE